MEIIQLTVIGLVMHTEHKPPMFQSQKVSLIAYSREILANFVLFEIVVRLLKLDNLMLPITDKSVKGLKKLVITIFIGVSHVVAPCQH
jgi:hypothetical protein